MIQGILFVHIQGDMVVEMYILGLELRGLGNNCIDESSLNENENGNGSRFL